MKRVLVPLDGSPEAENVLPMISEVCKPGDQVVLLEVIKPTAPVARTSMPGQAVRGNFAGLSGGVMAVVTPEVPVYSETVDQTEERRVNEAKDYLESLTHSINNAGIRVRIEVVTDGHPGEAIVKYAKTMQPTLIVMRQQTRGIAEMLLGSSTQHVVQSQVAPILLVPLRS